MVTEDTRTSGILDVVERRSGTLTAVGALLVPVVVAVVGAGINDSVSQREVAADYLDLAVTILSQPAAEEGATEDQALREYAVDLLAHSSPVELSEALRRQLTGGELLPSLAQPFPFDQQESITNLMLRMKQNRLQAWLDAEDTQAAAPRGCVVTVQESSVLLLVEQDPTPGTWTSPSIGPGEYEVSAIRKPVAAADLGVPEAFLLTDQGWVAFNSTVASTSNCGL